MSKTGQLYMDLEEQAKRLGFFDVGDACAHGYDIVGLELVEGSEIGLVNAHRAWEEKRDVVAASLDQLIGEVKFTGEQLRVIESAVHFIKNDCEGKV